MKSKLFVLNLKSRYKIVFWLTLALLLTFAVTPRGYAQDLTGTSTDAANGTTTPGTTTQPTAGSQPPEPTPAPTPPTTTPPPPAPTPPTVPPAQPSQQGFPYTQKFLISAYYSPLPNQSHYALGTYEAEIRMEGGGVHGADGTSVYPGMAAASKDVPFGTKMEVPGFGIVAIHDRGGAIKTNRLDLWMGTGEDGLARSVGWGMRTLEVKVLGIDPSIKEDVHFENVPMANIAKLPVATEYFNADLGDGDEGDTVRELQFFLKKLGYFETIATGYFGSETAQALQKFQLAEKVIDTLDDPGAGNFGPKTRVALEAAMNQRKTETLQSLPYPPLKIGDKNDSVSRLQNLLKEFGFLRTANGLFDEKTKEALIRMQMDALVITKAADTGAGYYGPKTKSALQGLITDSFTSSKTLSSQTQSSRTVKSLALGDRGPDVSLLQEQLIRLNFLGLKPTGYFGKITEHSVFKFQQAFKIVQNKEASGAGVAGPITLGKLQELASSQTARNKLVSQTTEKKQIIAARVEDEKVLLAGTLPQFRFDVDFTYGTRSDDVEKLQKLLKRLGFFQGKLTTQYFGDITKQSLIAFQKDHGLDSSGALDAQTRKILNSFTASPLSS